MSEIRMSSSVQNLLSKNLDDLYEELGRSIIAPELPRTGSVTRQNAVQRGRFFVSGSLEKLRAKICVDWRFCSKRGEDGDFPSRPDAIARLASSGAGVPATPRIVLPIIATESGLGTLW